ncbi:MAG: PAS domain-containing protein [Planctomycetota bacterium]|jgi:PAS domain S-box-containing protein
MNPELDFLKNAAQEDLRRFRLLVEQAPFCVHEIDLKGYLKSINPKGCDLLGCRSASEIEGRNFAELVTEESLSTAMDAFHRALQGESVEFECILRNPEGDVPTSSHLFPLTDDTGQVTSLFGLSIDVSKGSGALAELRRSEQRYRQMFETNLAVKFILDPKTGTIVEANPAAADFYGYTQEEMAGMSVFKINVLTPEEIHAEMAKAVHEERLTFEFRHRLKNGEIREVEVLSGPVDTPEGVRLYSIIVDITDRKRVEAELDATRERYELALKGSNDGIWDIDLVNKVNFWSDRCKALLGYGPKEIDANSANNYEYIHPDDRDRVRHCFQRHLDRREPYDLEIRLRHVDGNYLWFRTRGQAIWDKDGTPLRMSGSIRDIHERYEFSERLAISEQRLAFAVAGTKEGIWDWDIITGRAWWSPRFKDLLGYQDDEISASRERFYELMHPEDVERTRKSADDHILNGTLFDVRYRLRTRNGGYRWFQSRGQAVFDDDGKAVRASGAIGDVHEEVLAAEEQAERAKRLAKQQECILDLASDPTFGQAGLRAACQRITNLVCEVLDAGRCSVLVMEDDGGGLRSLDLYVRDKQAHFEGVVLEGKDLPKFFAELEKSRALVSRDPSQDSRFDEFPREFIRQRSVKSIIEVPVRRGGKLVGLIGISEVRAPPDWGEDEVHFALDVAQQVARLLEQVDARQVEEKQRDLERQMLQAQKMESLGLMAGGVAHDFNNLLVAILGNADLLRDLVAQQPQQATLVQEIESASRRAADLCQQMLAFSGHGRLSRTCFDLQELVREMSQLLKVTVSKDAMLEQMEGEDLPAMEGDATQVRQVILNLILNASESLTDGVGRINIRSGLESCSPTLVEFGCPVPEVGDYLTLEVCDDGVGMGTETLSKLFDPFFSTKFTGRGLGLASVLGIVRAHRGGIEVESTPGQGSRFVVRFPVTTKPVEPMPQVATPKPEWKGSGLVLLVDDDETVLQLGQEMLDRLGFEVLAVQDGQEAIETYRQRHQELRLVVLDLTMPGVSGGEVYVALQNFDASVPVIMSSGYTEQDVVDRLGPNGMSGFLQKPYTLEQLRATVQPLVAG